MLRIAFVCHGNICRSPMAEYIFKKMVSEAGLDGKISVSSFATSTDEIWGDIGNPVYPNAAHELSKRGIDCSDKHAVLLKRSDYDKFDLFIGMDRYNISNMTRLFLGDPKGKVSRLLSYASIEKDISDPWYTRRFDIAAGEVETGCKALLDYIKKQYFA